MRRMSYGARAYAKRCTLTMRSVATAGVLLFKEGVGVGPRVERSELSIKRSKPKGVRWGR